MAFQKPRNVLLPFGIRSCPPFKLHILDKYQFQKVMFKGGGGSPLTHVTSRISGNTIQTWEMSVKHKSSLDSQRMHSDHLPLPSP